jgi:hypothetical protein
MKYENVASKARVWTITRGAGGELNADLDRALVNALRPGLTSEQIADLLVTAAGAAEVAETRLW